VVLEENVAFPGFPEFVAIFEFALGNGGTELVAAPLEFQDFFAV